MNDGSYICAARKIAIYFGGGGAKANLFNFSGPGMWSALYNGALAYLPSRDAHGMIMVR